MLVLINVNIKSNLIFEKLKITLILIYKKRFCETNLIKQQSLLLVSLNINHTDVFYSTIKKTAVSFKSLYVCVNPFWFSFHSQSRKKNFYPHIDLPKNMTSNSICVPIYHCAPLLRQSPFHQTNSLASKTDNSIRNV